MMVVTDIIIDPYDENEFTLKEIYSLKCEIDFHNKRIKKCIMLINSLEKSLNNKKDGTKK